MSTLTPQITYQSPVASTSWVLNLLMRLFHIVPQPYLLLWSFMRKFRQNSALQRTIPSVYLFICNHLRCWWLISNRKPQHMISYPMASICGRENAVAIMKNRVQYTRGLTKRTFMSPALTSLATLATAIATA